MSFGCENSTTSPQIIQPGVAATLAGSHVSVSAAPRRRRQAFGSHPHNDLGVANETVR
jgi:hypothetical protein